MKTSQLNGHDNFPIVPKGKTQVNIRADYREGVLNLAVYLNMELLKNIDAWVPEYRGHSLSSGKRGEREVPMPALSLIPAGTVTEKDILLPLASCHSHMAIPSSVKFRGPIIVLQESALFCKSDAALGINLDLF